MAPSYCAVQGCRRSTLEKIRFFLIPKVRNWDEDLTTRRRNIWITRLGIKKISSHTRICADHFVCGKPAHYTDENNPDWAPNQKLQHNYVRDSSVKRYHRRLERSKKNQIILQEINGKKNSKKSDESASEAINDTATEGHLEQNNEKDVSDRPTPTVYTKLKSSLEELENAFLNLRISFEKHQTQAKEEKLMDAWIHLELAQATSDLIENQTRLVKTQPDFFSRCKNDNANLQFYTRLSSWSIFETIFLALEPAVTVHPRAALSLRQQFFLTLVKLAHNLKEKDLAFRFHIDQSTVSRYFHKWIHVIYHRLRKRVIAWPRREELKLSMPMTFRRNFPDMIAVFDAFEIPIESPHSPADQAATYSSYKSKNTVKYLISCTPQGTISFISVGYAGRVSDVFIVQESGFLDKIHPGDLVLANRGFNIEELLGLLGARLATPAFMRGRSQLTQKETEDNRKVSNVRIHIERVIGCLRMRFDILKGPLDIHFLYEVEDKLSFIDKIVTVCCIIANLNPSIVPFG